MATNHQVEEAALDAMLKRQRVERIDEELTEAEHLLAGERARVLRLRAERLRLMDTATGFCHCNGFFRGSDHCQCCGCEEFEGVCSHVCDMVGCSVEHDEKGRYV